MSLSMSAKAVCVLVGTAGVTGAFSSPLVLRSCSALGTGAGAGRSVSLQAPSRSRRRLRAPPWRVPSAASRLDSTASTSTRRGGGAARLRAPRLAHAARAQLGDTTNGCMSTGATRARHSTAGARKPSHRLLRPERGCCRLQAVALQATLLATRVSHARAAQARTSTRRARRTARRATRSATRATWATSPPARTAWRRWR